MKEYISRGVIGRVATCAMRWCRRYQLLNKDEKLNFKNNDGGDVWEKRPRGSEYQRMAHSQVTLVYIAPVPAHGTAYTTPAHTPATRLHSSSRPYLKTNWLRSTARPAAHIAGVEVFFAAPVHLKTTQTRQAAY